MTAAHTLPRVPVPRETKIFSKKPCHPVTPKRKALTMPDHGEREHPHRRIRKILLLQLSPIEAATFIRVLGAEERGEGIQLSHLGWSENLIRRGWLARGHDGNVTVSSATRELLAEAAL